MSGKKGKRWDSFLDEDNTFTRGVKRGAGWAFWLKSNPRLVVAVRVFFLVFGLFLVLRLLGVL